MMSRVRSQDGDRLACQLVYGVVQTVVIGDNGTLGVMKGTNTSRRAVLGSLIGATLLLRTGAGLAQSQVTPREHGAVGDGRTDDWRAFQRSLDAAAGGTLYVPPGRYRLSAGLVVPPNTTILAEGATLVWTRQVKALALGGGVTIDGGTLVGPGGRTYDFEGYAISATASATGPEPARRATSPGRPFAEPRFRGWGYAGIFLGFVKEASIEDCTITDIGYCAIGGISVEDVTIERNLIDGVGGSARPTATASSPTGSRTARPATRAAGACASPTTRCAT